jgi:hypothetical protein
MVMITTERNEFVGVHLTQSAKQALRTEASKRKISMSKMLYIFTLKQLREEGTTLTEHDSKELEEFENGEAA